MDLIKATKNNLYIQPQELVEAFQRSIVTDLNIYGQAFLENDRPLVMASIIHPKTKHEVGLNFQIQGDLQGSIICLTDKFNKVLLEQDEKLFNSLFQESMNILIGQILTNLEKNSDLLAVVSNPVISDSNNTELIINHNNMKLSLGYKLICLGTEFDTRIIFNINKK